MSAVFKVAVVGQLTESAGGVRLGHERGLVLDGLEGTRMVYAVI